MFSINAAPEKYQQVISQVFHDIEGVQSISDDIVVFGVQKRSMIRDWYKFWIESERRN